MKPQIPLIFCAFIFIVCTPKTQAVALKNQTATLDFARGATGFTLKLNAPNASFEQSTPLAIEVVDKAGAANWLYGAYHNVNANNGALNCSGELRSAHGTRFVFRDVYTREGDGFQVQRHVEIRSPNAQDAGFSSRFGLASATPQTVRDVDVLLPGAWYRQNQTVPPGWFGSDLSYEELLHRGDRLGLPLAMARDRKSGATLELERVGGIPTTIAGDGGSERLIDARLQFGSLGFLNTGRLQAVFQFPGSEVECAKLGSATPPPRRFAARAHPVAIGVAHNYTLHFAARPTASFAAAVEQTTKAAIARARPPLLRADLKQVYRAEMDLFNAVIQPYHGTVSVPFQVVFPTGEIKDTSMQMGFVGQALPCAALLLRDGLERKDQSAIERATKVVDFWVQQAPNPAGVPKNWADFPAPDKVIFRNYPTHLRVASDGMQGALQAWDIARKNGLDKPQWLQFARDFGDFLVAHQNADGSWFGSWNFDGTPHQKFTNATTHPIAFLVDLSKATGDMKYQNAALRAGEFCLKTVNDAYSYVGGTPDNPNVTDKEAGVMAVRAFLALYDASGDHNYLQAAQQSAIFCETWIYWRHLPIPQGTEKQVFPTGRNTTGMSLISTGHSGADNFMAIAPFWWYRIYLASGDAHFCEVARLLLHDTKQVIDWDGKLGYKYRGLMPEALSLSTNRGQGVAGWLPWLGFVVTEPLVQLQDTFGSMDIDVIERLPLKKRRALNAKFGRTRGFGSAKR